MMDKDSCDDDSHRHCSTDIVTVMQLPKRAWVFDETIKSLFWIGASYHHPVDLPDTSGLAWREAIIRCLESICPRSRTQSDPEPSPPPPSTTETLRQPPADEEQPPTTMSKPEPEEEGTVPTITLEPEPQSESDQGRDLFGLAAPLGSLVPLAPPRSVVTLLSPRTYKPSALLSPSIPMATVVFFFPPAPAPAPPQSSGPLASPQTLVAMTQPRSPVAAVSLKSIASRFTPWDLSVPSLSIVAWMLSAPSTPWLFPLTPPWAVITVMLWVGISGHQPPLLSPSLRCFLTPSLHHLRVPLLSRLLLLFTS
ncbi:hypothetical protein DPX16_5892 [Anabarilius grahami]|uniref:Uncharacterized protein n=1 Tax=Anabarilius grahami TaxID=495550 RepID=A0A3N0Y4A2_ANAGA|nr:hypothetical protein DPX16_5892 [Anabarilius grahami]